MQGSKAGRTVRTVSYVSYVSTGRSGRLAEENTGDATHKREYTERPFRSYVPTMILLRALIIMLTSHY